KMVFLPPQSDRTREMAAQVASAVPEASVVLAETESDAQREILGAEAAFGAISPAVLRLADRLAWLQAPAIAPPAGYYYPELSAHPVVVTNQRGIFNDRIPDHIMTFVLAFARGLHVYVRQQLRREWRRIGSESEG